MNWKLLFVITSLVLTTSLTACSKKDDAAAPDAVKTETTETKPATDAKPADGPKGDAKPAEGMKPAEAPKGDAKPADGMKPGEAPKGDAPKTTKTEPGKPGEAPKKP